MQEWLRPEYQTLGNAVQSSISTLAIQWTVSGGEVKLESPYQSTAFDIIQQTSPTPSTSVESILPDNTSFAVQMQWKPRQWQHLLFNGTSANEFHHFLEAWSDYRFAIAVGEPLSGDLSDDCTLAIGVQNEAALQKILPKADESSSYQSFQIHRLAEAGPLKALFQKLHNNPKHIAPNLYVAVLGKWLVVATQLSSLQIMIDKYIVGQVMAQSADYLLAKPQGNEQQQPILMWNNKQLPNILGALYQEPLSSHTIRAFQLSGWTCLQKQQSSGNQSVWLPGFQIGISTNLTPQYVWKTPFDADLVGSPQITSLDDSTHLILIQDALHKLHCTNTNGQTLWTKALDGPLHSKVHLITPFESRKPALLFNTAGNIYLLEAMQGDPIGGFPIHLRSPAANGLIPVFFEGKNENAFFLSNQNGFLYGYDQLGRPFEGWNAQHNTGKVTQPLVHYRYKSKDYIVAVNDQGIISTYGKFGEVRLPLIASELSPSAPVMLDTSGAIPRILFTDLKGQGVVCNANGEVFRMPLSISATPQSTKAVLTNYAGDARLDYAILQGKTLQIKVYQADNTLKTVLKHSFLEEQSDLFLPNNISATSGLVGTLARGTGQISLVRKGKGAVGGFPLAGTTPFALIRLQPDKYLLVVGDGSSLNAYRINWF